MVPCRTYYTSSCEAADGVASLENIVAVDDEWSQRSTCGQIGDVISLAKRKRAYGTVYLGSGATDRVLTWPFEETTRADRPQITSNGEHP